MLWFYITTWLESHFDFFQGVQQLSKVATCSPQLPTFVNKLFTACKCRDCTAFNEPTTKKWYFSSLNPRFGHRKVVVNTNRLQISFLDRKPAGVLEKKQRLFWRTLMVRFVSVFVSLLMRTWKMECLHLSYSPVKLECL